MITRLVTRHCWSVGPKGGTLCSEDIVGQLDLRGDPMLTRHCWSVGCKGGPFADIASQWYYTVRGHPLLIRHYPSVGLKLGGGGTLCSKSLKRAHFDEFAPLQL